jgi:hypothetical protein
MLSKVKICSIALIAAIPALAKANDSSAKTATSASQSGTSGIVLQHCIPVDGQLNEIRDYFAKKECKDEAASGANGEKDRTNSGGGGDEKPAIPNTGGGQPGATSGIA